MELLKADAAKDLEAPNCYIPIWVPVESPSDKIQRAMDELVAKEELAAKVITEAIVEVSKDIESNGKETETTEAVVTAGLSPTTKGNKSPKPQRERKKSKSKSGEEKSADEEEKMEKAEEPTPPKSPSKVDSTEDSKESPEESSKSPKKSVGEEELNTVQN